MPIPILAEKEFRDDNTHDHVDFGAERFDYDDNDFAAADGEIDFRLDEPEVSLSQFADRPLDARRDLSLDPSKSKKIRICERAEQWTFIAYQRQRIS